MPTICKQNQVKIKTNKKFLEYMRLVALSSLGLFALLIAPSLTQAEEIRLIYSNDTLGQLSPRG